MKKRSEVVPFGTDAEYLDQEFQWLHTRVHLLDVRKRLAEASDDTPDQFAKHLGRAPRVAIKEMSRKQSELQTLEANTRKILDTRLDAHRKHGTFTLGLDALCEDHGLTGDERLVLLSLTLPAVSTTLASDVYATMNVYNGNPQVVEILELLSPENTRDYLRCRHLFGVGSALIKNNLIVLDYRFQIDNPTAIWSADVFLTMEAFAAITGMSDMGRSLQNDGEGRIHEEV